MNELSSQYKVTILSMGKVPIYHLNAFTYGDFTGNPAAVCSLDRMFDDNTLQKIAVENGHPATSFLLRRGPKYYELRWFSPETEMNLCGHGTLAAAYVAFNYLAPNSTTVRFATKSGELQATLVKKRATAKEIDALRKEYEQAVDLASGATGFVCGTPFWNMYSRLNEAETTGDLITLALPAREMVACADDEQRRELESALGVKVAELWKDNKKGGFYCAVVADPQLVERLRPNLDAVQSKAGIDYLIVTASDDNDGDFVSRVFVPGSARGEDPVTGSAHCCLAPYWGKRLGKREMVAHQVSPRGGKLWLKNDEKAVQISGHVTSYLEGWITPTTEQTSA